MLAQTKGSHVPQWWCWLSDGNDDGPSTLMERDKASRKSVNIWQTVIEHRYNISTWKYTSHMGWGWFSWNTECSLSLESFHKLFFFSFVNSESFSGFGELFATTETDFLPPSVISRRKQCNEVILLYKHILIDWRIHPLMLVIKLALRYWFFQIHLSFAKSDKQNTALQ